MPGVHGVQLYLTANLVKHGPSPSMVSRGLTLSSHPCDGCRPVEVLAQDTHQVALTEDDRPYMDAKSTGREG